MSSVARHHEPTCTGIKVCKTCHAPLHVLAFCADPSCIDGVSQTCRNCTNTAEKRVKERNNLRARTAEKKASLTQFPLANLDH